MKLFFILQLMVVFFLGCSNPEEDARDINQESGGAVIRIEDFGEDYPLSKEEIISHSKDLVRHEGEARGMEGIDFIEVVLKRAEGDAYEYDVFLTLNNGETIQVTWNRYLLSNLIWD